MATLNPEAYLIIHYEDLRNISSREGILQTIVQFIYPNKSKELLHQDRIRCAFELSDNPTTHRRNNDAPSAITANDAFFARGNDLVCQVWATLSKSNLTKTFNYSIFGSNTTCS